MPDDNLKAETLESIHKLVEEKQKHISMLVTLAYEIGRHDGMEESEKILKESLGIGDYKNV